VDEESPQPTLPRPGDTIAGKYAIVKVIGEGGMGLVYEANHLRLRRRVALKMLLPHMMATSSDTVARFEREARAAANLRDRHVTKVLDVDVTADGLPYLVMEYLEGHDLEAELAARGPLPVDESCGYVLQACAAMTEAHAAGIIHRDLKPSNLFLCPEKDGWIVKVLDFGISKMADDGDARLTGTQASVGTPLYMSPEQVRSAKSVDLRSDIWSLGVILYELLAGRTPFEGSTTAAAASIVADPTPPLTDHRDDIPKELEETIYRALAKDPAERFPSVTEFAQAIAPFAGVIRPSVQPPPAPSGGALTPSPYSRPVTPPPSHPSHPSRPSDASLSQRSSDASRSSRPSGGPYPRAGEDASTMAAAASLRASSSDVAVPPALKQRSGKRRGLAIGGAAVLLAAGVAVFSLQRAARHEAAVRSAAPPPVPDPAAVVATPVAAVNSAAPARVADVAPVAPPEVTSAAALPPPSHAVARPGTAPAHPVSHPQAAPSPAGSAAPTAPPAAASQPTHGSSNPLFL
jgi:serine/threonine-protein kinase